MQRGPNSSALRTPFQFLGGCGSRHRRAPTGGWAKGTPLKLRTPSLAAALDWSVPFAVLTRSVAKESWAATIARAKHIGLETLIGFSVYQQGAGKGGLLPGLSATWIGV